MGEIDCWISFKYNQNYGVCVQNFTNIANVTNYLLKNWHCQKIYIIVFLQDGKSIYVFLVGESGDLWKLVTVEDYKFYTISRALL